MAWLSVVIPTFNGERYLRQALESIVMQQATNIEVIAIDNGSEDATLSILEDYTTRLPLKILVNSTQQNWVASTNLGLANATGNYIAFLHQDDYWLPGRLDHMRLLIARNPELVLFLHPVYFVDKRNRRLGQWRCPFAQYHLPLDKTLVHSRLLVQNFISVPAPIFRRDVAILAGELDESLWFTADWKFWLKLAALGNWLYSPTPLACFRIHSESQTVSGGGTLPGYREQYSKVLQEYLPELEHDPRLKRIVNFSAQTNVMLAEFFRSRKFPNMKYIWSALMLGPHGWIDYVRFSRIHERLWPRLKESIRR